MKCQTCHKWMPQASMKIADDPEAIWFFIVCPHCKEEHMGMIAVENFMTKSRWDDPSQWEGVTPDQAMEGTDTSNH
ncbi:hypothetical protein ES702_05758 [subsurface metagenome]